METISTYLNNSFECINFCCIHNYNLVFIFIFYVDPDDPGQKSPPLSLNSSFDSQPLPLKQKFTSTPKVGLESKPLHFYLDPSMKKIFLTS